jgi:hypothetical protein
MKVGKSLNRCINYYDGEEEYYEESILPSTNISNDNNNLIEVQVYNDLYKIVRLKDKESGQLYEEERLVKKNCKTKETLYKQSIVGIKEILNSKGQPYKTKLQLVIDNGKELIIQGNYNKYKQDIFSIRKPNKIGFI